MQSVQLVYGFYVFENVFRIFSLAHSVLDGPKYVGCAEEKYCKYIPCLEAICFSYCYRLC